MCSVLCVHLWLCMKDYSFQPTQTRCPNPRPMVREAQDNDTSQPEVACYPVCFPMLWMCPVTILQTCLHTDKSTLFKNIVFFRKVTVSSVFSHGPGTVTSHTGSMWKIWRLHYAGLRFASWQEHLFPRCFGVFCISSFLSHFVLSENNLKMISTWHPENGERSYFAAETQLSLALTGPRIQYRDYTKPQLKTDTMAARGCEINTCATENPDLGIFHAGLIFASWQEHLFPHCFGTFSISSFLFHFVLSENNLKITSTWLPEKWWMLVLCSRNTMKPCFELSKCVCVCVCVSVCMCACMCGFMCVCVCVN